MDLSEKDIVTTVFGFSIIVLSATGFFFLNKDTEAAIIFFASAGLIGASAVMLQLSD